MTNIKYIKSETIFPIIKEILNSGKSARITVTGMSMYPFLRENVDSIELSLAKFSDIRRGNIVLILRDSKEYVLHRVIKVETNCFYIIGDAQQWIEGPLRPDQLIAKATAVWRDKKYISCSNTWWRLLSLLWLWVLPFRNLLIKAHGNFHKVIKICSGGGKQN